MRIFQFVLFSFSCLIFNYLSSQSLRGISIVNDSVYWLSGSQGNVWFFKEHQGTNATNLLKRDFRDIHAWNAEEALVMSIADSGRLLKTVDGGRNWNVVHQDNEEGVFFDVIEFNDQGNLGMLLGDPLKIDSNHLYFRLSIDSGNHWLQMNDGQWNSTNPHFSSLYAASGSSLKIIDASYNEGNADNEPFINAIFIIGGGGSQGASVRWVKIQWNLYGEIINENIYDLNLPLPQATGWGVYGLSSIHNGTVLAGGGHWQHPDGKYKDSIYSGAWKLVSLSNFTDCKLGDIEVESLEIPAYISGLDLNAKGDFVCVGSIGKFQGNIYSSSHSNIYDFSPLESGFKGYNAVKISNNTQFVIGTNSTISVLKFPF